MGRFFWHILRGYFVQGTIKMSCVYEGMNDSWQAWWMYKPNCITQWHILSRSEIDDSRSHSFSFLSPYFPSQCTERNIGRNHEQQAGLVFGSKKILSNSRYGCRRRRLALVALSHLDAQIYEAEASHVNLYSVFFDIPWVWTHHICTILHYLGFRGPSPPLFQNYLQKRTFCVRAASHHSSSHNQENSILQGSPLSSTLFLITINGITEIINSPFHTILVSDDFSIHLQSGNSQRAHRLVQKTIHQVNTWLSSRVFRISSFRTNFIIFQKRKPPISFPPSYSIKPIFPV